MKGGGRQAENGPDRRAETGLIAEAAGNPENVAEVVITGNTTMHHLGLGLPVEQLGKAPYRPMLSRPLDIKARSVGLKNSARGLRSFFYPSSVGFVGADHVSMLMATGISKTTKTVPRH